MWRYVCSRANPPPRRVAGRGDARQVVSCSRPGLQDRDTLREASGGCAENTPCVTRPLWACRLPPGLATWVCHTRPLELKLLFTTERTRKRPNTRPVLETEPTG